MSQRTPKPAPSRQGIAERIAATLRTSIVRGRLQPGDALPSERALAEQFEANRSTVREAVKRLEGWGLVTVRHGGATRVTDFLLSAGFELLPHLVSAQGAVEPEILADLHEVRAMILGWCAEQAATKADAASIARLEELVRQMGLTRGVTALQDLDYDFFEALVAITGNRVLGLFANVVRDVYLSGRARFAGMYAPGVFELAHHREAVEAIRARDPAAAGTAMRAHALTALRTLEAP